MDSYKVFQSICLALVLSCVRADHVPCHLRKDLDHPAVRLAPIADTGGRAEVMCGDEWGTISDTNWNADLTEIFCSELGFNGGEQVKNMTTEGQGPVLEMQCTGSEVSIRECNFTKLEPDQKEMFDALSYMDPVPFWSHTNDVMLKCLQPDKADLSKSSIQQLQGQSNIGQDSPDAVKRKEASSSDSTLLVLFDGIEFVLLLVAVVVTGVIVYRKAIQKMKVALKEKRSPETQSMLDLSQVTVQHPSAPAQNPQWRDPQEGQSWRTESAMQNPSYGRCEKY